jgi:hypothetical protein
MTDQSTTDVVSLFTIIFALTLALSFVIERILEVSKAAFDMYDSRGNRYEGWTRRAERIQQYIERRLRVFEYVDESAAAAFLQRFQQMLAPNTDEHPGTVPVLSGDLVRFAYVRASLKIVGCVIGIILAFVFRLDLLAISHMAPPDKATGVVASIPHPSIVGRILTGVAVGLGSGIVHKLITQLEKRQNAADAEASHA